MSQTRLFTVREICERALRKINAFSLMDTEADALELEEATWWLDMLVSHLCGANRILWLVPQTLTFALTAKTLSYDLKTTLGDEYPDQGIQFPLHATATYVEASTTTANAVVGDDAAIITGETVLTPRQGVGTTRPVEIVKRVIFDEISDRDQAGPPEQVYIDRLAAPMLRVHPVPQEEGWWLNLTVQTYQDDLIARGNAHKAAEITSNHRAAWNLYLVTALAHQLGNGPVRKLTRDEVRDMATEASDQFMALMAFENQEHDGEAQLVRFRNL